MKSGEPSIRELICEPRERYRKASFVAGLGSGDGRFLLDEPELGARNATVSKADLDGSEFRPGQTVELFLVRLTHQKNWICRLWSQGDNPWLLGALPKVLQEISGTVTGFVEDFIANVELDIEGTEVEAQLHRENLPEGHARPIQQTLEVGDRIHALVESIDIKRLRINLDVKGWRAGRLEAARRDNREKRNRDSSPQHAAEPKPQTNAPLSGLMILVVDDDGRLRAALARWFALLGGKVETASDEAETKSVLARFEPTHALLDYSLNNPEHFDKCARLLKSRSVPVAVFTGRPDRARAQAAAHGFGLIAKPASLDDLRNWLTNPHPASALAPAKSPGRERSRHWTYEARADWIAGKAGELLKRLCDRHDCAAALWLVELRPTVFELNAFAGKTEAVDLSSLLGRLAQSVVTNALVQGQPIQGPLSINDPMWSVAESLGLPSPHYMALPILLQGMRPRIIAFLKNGSFHRSPADLARPAPDTFDRIMFRKDHFELLIWATQEAAHVDQVEAFATQGRLAGAALHEGRNLLTGLFADTARLSHVLDGHDRQAARRIFDDVGDGLKRLSSILAGGLELIRADRRALTNVDRIVERTVGQLRAIAAEIHGKERLTIVFQSSGTRLVTAVPPMALEQALVNLVENAVGFLPDENWAQIRVIVEIDTTDRGTPIHVDIVDNGPGLTADQASRLFEPRVTSKRQFGTGLGLYVSRNLLQMAGGVLRLCDTARWGGAHFRIGLPAVFGTMDDEARE